MDIDQRALDLAKHLLDIETKSKIRKNKRSPSDIDKFIKSTQWLSKRILSNYAASKKAQTRLARDKNRYKASSHNAYGVTYDILILGVVYCLTKMRFLKKKKVEENRLGLNLIQNSLSGLKKTYKLYLKRL